MCAQLVFRRRARDFVRRVFYQRRTGVFGDAWKRWHALLVYEDSLQYPDRTVGSMSPSKHDISSIGGVGTEEGECKL